ncbi:MAG: hypothetical protein G01um101429_883 [Parcubacteria group bacterium Gr01-1014_29]|nr:MAG: hypothetical protein G01um101429_883 [Parcubacteria group bacterium Gr01-1014_29]
MMQRFLVDENLSPGLAEWLRILGYEAHAAREVGLKGKRDEEIISWLKAHSAVIITSDLDFGVYFYAEHFGNFGVIICRSKRQGAEAFKRILENLHTNGLLKEKDLIYSIVAATERQYRKRTFKKERTRGFTLVELLVTISIISVLASVVLTNVNSAREKARIGAGKQFYSSLDHAFGASAVGSWSFEEGSGTTIRDSSGENNSGSFVGTVISWQTSSQCGLGFGRCMFLDGADSFEIPNSPSINVGANFTVSAWVNMSTMGAFGSCGFIITKGVYPDYSYKIEICGSEASWAPSRFQAIIGMDGAQRIATDNVARTTGRWYHVAQTYDGSTIKLYVDGALSASYAYSGVPAQSTYPAVIGRYYSGGWFFNGMIDEVRIYSEALTAYQIQQMYGEGASTHRVAEKR